MCRKEIDRIIKSKSCLGCGLCIAEDSPKGMVMSDDGFLHPSEDAKIDSSFLRYCPGVRIEQERDKRGDEIVYGPLAAPVVAGWASDEDVHYKASSGGVITSVLIALMEYGLVDAVLQIKESKQDPSISESVLSETKEEIMACVGSRYAPSSLFEHFPQILKTGKRLAVVGKPCDIAALHAYLKVHTEYANQIKYTLSMMCMGLPSHNATKKMIRFLGAEGKELTTVRYRGFGWPGSAMVKAKDGFVNQCTYIESWGAILGRDTLFRCKLCPIGFGEFDDISCGDAWYCKDGEPVFENDSANGRSLIFMRTKKGKEMIERMVRDGRIQTEQYAMEEMPYIQKSQYQRKTSLLGRYMLFKLLICPNFKLRGFHLTRLARIAGVSNIKKDIRGFLGRYWRDYKGKKR